MTLNYEGPAPAGREAMSYFLRVAPDSPNSTVGVLRRDNDGAAWVFLRIDRWLGVLSADEAETFADEVYASRGEHDLGCPYRSWAIQVSGALRVCAANLRALAAPATRH